MSKVLKTMNIKGKPYVLVNERIKAFRVEYPAWSLESEVIELTNERCVIRAVIKDENGVVRATGIAYEEAGSTYINKTSYVENCETSAWGRALGNLGIGIDTSIASAEEVQNAVTNQDSDVPYPEAEEGGKVQANDLFMINQIMSVYPKENRATSLKAALAKYKVDKPEELTKEQFVSFREELLNAAEGVKAKRLEAMITSFAKKAGRSEEEAKDILETALSTKFEDVTIANFGMFAQQYLQMYNDLERGNE